jgi:hypothetical protein
VLGWRRPQAAPLYQSTAAGYLRPVFCLVAVLCVLAGIGYGIYWGVVDSGRMPCHRILDLDANDTRIRELHLKNSHLNTFYLRDSDTDRDLYRFRFPMDDLISTSATWSRPARPRSASWNGL